jgi:hypothetical protein
MSTTIITVTELMAPARQNKGSAAALMQCIVEGRLTKNYEELDPVFTPASHFLGVAKSMRSKA